MKKKMRLGKFGFDFCFNVSCETHISELIVNKEEEIAIRLEVSPIFKLNNPELFKAAFLKIEKDGSVTILPENLHLLKGFVGSTVLPEQETATLVASFINECNDCKEEMAIMRNQAVTEVKKEMNEEFERLKNNEVLIHCIKANNEDLYLVSTEKLLDKEKWAPRYRSVVSTAIGTLAGVENFKYEDFEEKLKTILKTSPKKIPLGTEISLTPKKVVFYIKQLSMGVENLKEILEMAPLY